MIEKDIRGKVEIHDTGFDPGFVFKVGGKDLVNEVILVSYELKRRPQDIPELKLQLEVNDIDFRCDDVKLSAEVRHLLRKSESEMFLGITEILDRFQESVPFNSDEAAKEIIQSLRAGESS